LIASLPPLKINPRSGLFYLEKKMPTYDLRKIFFIFSSLILVLIFKNFSEETTMNRLLFLYAEICLVSLAAAFPKAYKSRR
jgi:hypothetical protein